MNKKIVMSVLIVFALVVGYISLPKSEEKIDISHDSEKEFVLGEEVTYPEDSLEFQYGQWYSPYVKIYSIGGNNRIAEISNYPRAYKDLSPHVYEEDTIFTVTERNLNSEVDGEMVYIDSQGSIFYVNETAIHYAGEPLPGAFPIWLESEELSFDEYVFNVSAIPGSIFDVCEETVRLVGSDVYVKISDSTTINKIRDGLLSGTIQVVSLDKMIIRVQYKR